MTLILIRHGESEANKQGQHQGRGDNWYDTPLSEKGRKQAGQVSERLKTEEIDYIFASDLKRAKETAEKINHYHNKKIHPDSRLREKRDEEDMKEFIRRLKKFLKYTNKFEGNILIVAHGGVNQTLLAISTGSRKKGAELAQRVKMHNTSVSIVYRREEGHYDIKLKSCIKHLDHDDELIKTFEKVQKIPYKIKPFNGDKIEENLEEPSEGNKSELLKKLLKEKGYTVKGLQVIFDWKDLPIPKRILNILKKSSTKQLHKIARVKVHGNYLYLDPTWPKYMEKLGFPVTKNWSGLEDTKQVTEGKLKFFKNRKIRNHKQEIFEKHGIKQDKKELDKFGQELNKWLEEETKKIQK